MKPGSGLARKSNQQADEYYDAASDEAAYDDAEVMNAIKRLAVSNKIDGVKVDTRQNIKEVNANNRGWKRTKEVEDALSQLAKALRRIAIVNDLKGNQVNTNQKVQEFNEESKMSPAVRLALQRLAISNNIKGNKVNTEQEVNEYNDDVVEALTKALRRNSEKSYSYDDSLKPIIEKLRRIAIQNRIDGGSVNTKQEVNEYNNNVVKELTDSVRRLSLKNKIAGKVVNTNQKVTEVNEGSDFSEIAKRLILAGSSMKQDSKDDSYDDGTYDQPEIIKSFDKLSEIFSPLKNIKENKLSNNSSDEAAVPSTDDEISQINFTDRKSPSVQKIFRRFGYQNSLADAPTGDSKYYYDAAAAQTAKTENDNESDDYDEDDNEGDDDDYDDDYYSDDYYADDYNYDYQADEQNARRMTVNNNVARLNDESSTVKSSDKSQSTLTTNPGIITPMKILETKHRTSSAAVATQTEEPKIAPKEEEEESKSKVICKTKKGKKITEKNLKRVLAMLGKMKVDANY